MLYAGRRRLRFGRFILCKNLFIVKRPVLFRDRNVHTRGRRFLRCRGVDGDVHRLVCFCGFAGAFFFHGPLGLPGGGSNRLVLRAVDVRRQPKVAEQVHDPLDHPTRRRSADEEERNQSQGSGKDDRRPIAYKGFERRSHRAADNACADQRLAVCIEYLGEIRALGLPERALIGSGGQHLDEDGDEHPVCEAERVF